MGFASKSERFRRKFAGAENRSEVRVCRRENKMAEKVAIEKLGDHNWPLWKFKINLILGEKGLSDIVKGEKPAEPTNDWISKDGVAQSVIGRNYATSWGKPPRKRCGMPYRHTTKGSLCVEKFS